MEKSSLIPGMMYRDAPTAMEWLCRVFGFVKHAVYPGPGNTIMHAELTLGGGMIMIGSVVDKPYRNLMRQPDEIGGAETRSLSIIVADADAVYARAVKEGAEIVLDIADKDYGGRGFTCRDPEGHIRDSDRFSSSFLLYRAFGLQITG